LEVQGRSHGVETSSEVFVNDVEIELKDEVVVAEDRIFPNSREDNVVYATLGENERALTNFEVENTRLDPDLVVPNTLYPHLKK
jgi:hypothetical protein